MSKFEIERLAALKAKGDQAAEAASLLRASETVRLWSSSDLRRLAMLARKASLIRWPQGS